MEIKILELMETKARFILSGTRPEVANALRRCLVSEIPKMAIDTVEFHLGPIRDEEGNEYESVSPLFDEIIAHRLGMVPIPTDLGLFTFREKCTCGGEGCPNCTIMYSLNKKGPCEVYSGDLEPLGGNELRVKDELIPIVKLGPGQALLIYASAQLGTAKQHAKWQVTSGVGYKYYPEISIDYGKCEGEDACFEACPRGCFGKKDGKTVVVDQEACVLCMACVEKCANKAVTVKGNQEKFIFEFETDGSLSAEKTLLTALEIMEKKFEEFRELVSSFESQ